MVYNVIEEAWCPNWAPPIKHVLVPIRYLMPSVQSADLTGAFLVSHTSHSHAFVRTFSHPHITYLIFLWSRTGVLAALETWSSLE